MAKKKSARKATRKAAARPSRRKTSPTRSTSADPLLAAIKGNTERRDVGGVRLDVSRAGEARVKRMVYPVGFRWSKDMKPISGTNLCMHAHVGFLAKGAIHVEYGDGCVVKHTAPQFLAIEPGHDGWVVGSEPAVVIEFDFERDTVRRVGMPDVHRHG